MTQKDNLEQLYRERYKDLETTPRVDLWQNIAAQLPEKKSKTKVLPLWYQLSGAAAGFALLFLIGYTYLEFSASVDPQVVINQYNRNSEERDLELEEFNKSMSESSEMLAAMRQNTLEKLRQEQYREQYQFSYANIAEDEKKAQNVLSNPEVLVAGISGPSTPEVVKNFVLPVLPIAEVTASAEEGKKDLRLEALEENTISKFEDKWAQGKKFQFKTTAAAVYYDNLGQGNAIDNQFAGNEGGGDISFSYGVAVSYALSKKLSVRSGVNKVDLSYNTRDVAYSSALSAAAISNGEIRTMSLASPIIGELNQTLGFIEVPVELKYGIVNNKLGLNLIGGASTLFLNENNVTLETGNSSTSFGEARNLNSVSFSTNVGVGVDYNISPNFQVNLEPIFKYQLNTFNAATNVKPYYFGIYSGLSFRF